MEEALNANNTKVEARSSEEILEDINATSDELMTVATGDDSYSVTTTTVETRTNLNDVFGSNAKNVEVGMVVALIVSFVIALVIFFAITMRKKMPKGKFMRYLREFLNFRKVWIAGILKFAYVFAALFLTIGSIVVMIFMKDQEGFVILAGILSIIFGNIALRICYELVMILIGLWQNTNDIRAVLVKDEEAPEPEEPKEEVEVEE